MNISKSKSGFTMIEIVIVVTIISLVMVGIFKSKDLVDAYRRQKVVKEYNEYLSAFRTFQGKYGYLPGDFPEATRIWPNQQNGNGNGYMDQASFVQYGEYLEGVYGWGHLVNDGLISGSYTGNVCSSSSGICAEHVAIGFTGTGYYITAGINSPRSSAPTNSTADKGKPQWLARSFNYFQSSNPTDWETFDWNFNANYFQILNDYVFRQTGNQTAYASMNCKDVFLIDFKSDDARPFTGDVTVPVSGGCVASVNDSAARGSWSYDGINTYTPTSVTMPMFRIGDSE